MFSKNIKANGKVFTTGEKLYFSCHRLFLLTQHLLLQNALIQNVLEGERETEDSKISFTVSWWTVELCNGQPICNHVVDENHKLM
jgi:hypothetical protein